MSADALWMNCDRDEQTDMSSGASHRDRGNTFSEILIAIVLMGFAFSAVIAGMRAVVVASSTSDEQAKVEAVLNSASDRLSNWAYLPCPGSDGAVYAPIVSAASAAVGWENSTVTILSVEYWDPSLGGGGSTDPIDADGGWSTSNSFTGTACNEDINLTTSRTLQKIEIQVQSPSGDVTRRLEIVKSNIVADPDES